MARRRVRGDLAVKVYGMLIEDEATGVTWPRAELRRIEKGNEYHIGHFKGYVEDGKLLHYNLVLDCERVLGVGIDWEVLHDLACSANKYLMALITVNEFEAGAEPEAEVTTEDE